MAGLKSSQYTDLGAARAGDNYMIGEILNKNLSGNSEHSKQSILNWNATQYKTNQTLSGSPATWDTANRYFPFGTLTVTASQNVNLSNVRDTASGTLLITKNTTSDVVITFGGSGLTHSPASVSLVNSTINTIFVVKWEANGTAIKWSLGFETIDSKFSNGVGNLTSDATLIGLGGSPLVEDTTIQGGTGSPLTPSYNFNFDNLTSLNLDASEHSSALFRIESTTQGSKFAGTMSTAQRDAIATPLEGISVYNSDDNEYQYYNGSAWSSFGVTPVSPLSEIVVGTGTGRSSSPNFTWDDDTLYIDSDLTGSTNQIISFENAAGETGGISADFLKMYTDNSSQGINDTIVWSSGDSNAFDFWSGSSGSVYLGGGIAGISHAITGDDNVVIGSGSAWRLTTGSFNVFVGGDIGGNFTEGSYNTLLGYRAGEGNIFADHIINIGYLSASIGANSMCFNASGALLRTPNPGGGSGGQIFMATRVIENDLGHADYDGLLTVTDLYLGKGRFSGSPITTRLKGTNGWDSGGVTNINGGNLEIVAGSKQAAGTDGSVKIVDGTGATVFEVDSVGFGVFATAPTAQETVTGSRAGNAALADLLTKLANKGIIIDGTVV